LHARSALLRRHKEKSLVDARNIDSLAGIEILSSWNFSQRIGTICKGWVPTIEAIAGRRNIVELLAQWRKDAPLGPEDQFPDVADMPLGPEDVM
jgi:hypothetical protein